MHLTVKILKGPECTVEASGHTTVLELKEQVSNRMSVPVAEQRLVWRGKTLVDEKTVTESGLVPSGKLYLVVKKVEEVTNANDISPSTTSQSGFWEELHTFLLRHYTPADSKLVLEQFQKDFVRNMASLSLDDIERLAINNLQKKKYAS